MRIVQFAASCALLLAPTAARVRADLILVTFSGQVGQMFGGPVMGMSPNQGDPITGQFVYDTLATDLVPGNAQYGDYNSGSFSLLIGSHTLSGSGESRLGISEGGPSSGDSFSMTHGIPAGTGALLVDGVPFTGGYINFSFSVSAPGLLNDSPPDALQFATLEFHQILIQDFQDPSGITIDMPIAFSVAAIPELSAFCFGGLICSAGVLWQWRQRRSKRVDSPAS